MLSELVDPKGRIPYDGLKAMLGQISLSEFTEQARHPFLVGKELYDGELRKKAGASSSTSTIRFTNTETDNHLENKQTRQAMDISENDEEASPSITHAIYMLRKRRFAPEDEENVFKIGRSQDNDIIIADYVISKHHAEIILFRNMYFILDSNSTNGTKVNGRPVTSQMKIQLQVNSVISFGRYAFVFAPPLQLFRAIRREIIET
ncbi:MAG: hypothetical protein A2020_13960 [Lentisphaerae bacterium GWF2_45_14]|nr:MAG: hypothetical protein A2020_13960 [Lentisphaerae bacterium GWF2_45_14]